MGEGCGTANIRIEKIVNSPKFIDNPRIILRLIFVSVLSRASVNMTARLGTVEAAAIADVELLTSAGFEENTSRKNAAAVVNENQAELVNSGGSTKKHGQP